MKVLFVSSEVAPFAKVGGLGDVAAALPRALAQVGHDVRVVMPCYRRVWESGHAAKKRFPAIDLDMGGRRFSFETFEAQLPDSAVPVYLVHCPRLYDRPGVYGSDADEHIRFALLNWASLRIAQQLGFAPDIVHANDWQSALLPLMLRRVFAWDRLFQKSRSVLTIHNLGHQGTFSSSVLREIGLANEADAFHRKELEAGRLSFLLTGILYANAITTVSPTYAREIQTDEQGVGLAPYLRARSNVLFGILNGIDEQEWNPSNDPHLVAPYSRTSPEGKEANKRALLGRLGLPYRPGVPVIGVLSRLVWQKGFDLCAEALPALLRQRNVQLAVVGKGEAKYVQMFSALARAAPDRVAFQPVFSEPLAHLLEAGSDIFLMPSRYEPCGLNQMYSLAYGTPPIVHRTGGLADTVRLWNPRTQQGTGFVFDHFDVKGLKWALGTAVDTYSDRAAWEKLMDNGFAEQNGWSHRVREYEELYRALLPHPAAVSA